MDIIERLPRSADLRDIERWHRLLGWFGTSLVVLGIIGLASMSLYFD